MVTSPSGDEILPRESLELLISWWRECILSRVIVGYL